MTTEVIERGLLQAREELKRSTSDIEALKRVSIPD